MTNTKTRTKTKTITKKFREHHKRTTFRDLQLSRHLITVMRRYDLTEIDLDNDTYNGNYNYNDKDNYNDNGNDNGI